MRIVVLLAVLAISAGCATNHADYWLPEPEIRVYAEGGVPIPRGGLGGAVHIYGVKVKEDGSEIVIWKHFMWEWGGLLFNHSYSIIDDKSGDHVLLNFEDEEYEPDYFFKFNKQSGKYLGKIKATGPAFSDLTKGAPVRRQMINRPETPYMSGQCHIGALKKNVDNHNTKGLEGRQKPPNEP